jgi:pimeloyl-ACP methyl ester carboxylesterase
MKNLLLSLCFLALASKAFAQVPSCNAPVPLAEQFRDMTKNLDKTQITTGILYENVFPWAELESYDGTSTTDTSSYFHFMQSYNELYNAKFNTSNLTHPNDLETAVNNFHPDKEFHHPFGIIDYTYNTIKPDAVTNNLLYVQNSKLYDVAGRTQSPYQTNTVSIGTILLADNSQTLTVGTHYLHFSPDFVLSNTGFNYNNVQSINIYINGLLSVNQVVTSFSNVVIPILIDVIIAPIVITVVIVVADIFIKTQILKSLFSKKEKLTLTTCLGQDELVVTGASFDGGYGQAAYGAKGRANIFYGAGNCAAKKLTKPIIFVDGFDPTNIQHGKELWFNYINKLFQNNSGQDTKLGDSLIAKGFDVITFDQADVGFNRGGGGFMENNALALVKLIDSLYILHQSTLQQDFIIVGASMGGLVVRYALTYMEHNNLPHHTRLFVSFDSPQLGAQIPVGAQQFLDLIGHYGGLKGVGAVQDKAVHLTDAARQLLVHHSRAESETVQADPYRTIFLNNLNSLGSWPQNLRKIAIIDGNKNGILKSVIPIPRPPGFEPLYSCGYELNFGIKRRLNKNCT